jgi:hypothetical protein
MFRFNKILVLCLVIISCTSVHARRRSRIDLPIKNAAEAPLEDNVAMASGVEEETISSSSTQPITTDAQTDMIESSSEMQSESSSSEELIDCENIDNISFELVTG